MFRKKPIVSKFLAGLVFVSYVYADEYHATFIQDVFITEAKKILQQENKFLDTEMNRAPRPDSPVVSHPVYPVGPLQGPQGPQGKPGPAGNGLASCGPFKLLEAATAGDVVRLVPDPTNQFGAKAAIRKIKKGPLFDWATRTGGTGSDFCYAVVTDCQGNVYVTGQFSGTVTFGNGITQVSAGSDDIFVAKLNSITGEWVWATRAGSTGSDIGNDIAIDCQGNVYVTGQFSGTVTFGNDITQVSAGSDDIFVAKLNSTTGEWVWATRAGSTGNDIARGVETDCQGAVYVTGLFQLTVTFGNAITLVSAGNFDIFVAKLNPTTGEWIWATRAGEASGNQAGNDITLDCSGNLYITGDFLGTVTFGNNITLVSNANTQDIYVAKLNLATGEWVWATRAGGPAFNDIGHDIATDFQGNVYITGSFQGVATFGNNITLVSKGSLDIFAAKLNSTTGEWTWVMRVGSTTSDQGNGITTDCQGNIYITGQFTGTVTFGNNITLVSNGASSDILIAKIIDDERSLKVHGILQEGGTAGTYKNALFSGLFVSPLSSLTPAADYYIDSTLTLTPCCCRCSKCCDANFKFMGTACSPTELILQNCC